MNLHVGTSGYSYAEWKGTFYPDKLSPKKMLAYYAGHFRTVEINATFYGPPKPGVLANWAAAVPPGFRFVLKAPREITHAKKLKDAGEITTRFLDAAAALGDRLGPVLFQLPPFLKKDAPRLRDFLAGLPAGCRAAFEFRHPSWFGDEVFGVLRENGAVLCVAEADDDLQVPCAATAGWGYLRLRRAEYADADLAAWAERLRSRAWAEAFVFFKHEDAGTGPRLAKRLLDLWDAPTVERRAA
jgi:uncharacterized protein YecE (DUF72 family)